MADALTVEQELLWRRCAVDEAFFLENFWYIKHPERGRTLMRLRPAQQETLEVWEQERYTIALKARQIGFSTLAGAHAVWLAFFHPDRFIIMLSRTERDAVKLLQKSKYGYKYLPKWMLKRGPQLLDDNQSKMSWDHDSAIESLPSASDPARGESVYLIIVDEWAFLPNAEEAWASIEPVTDVGGRVIGISTANGAGNFFHDFYVAGKTGASNFKSIFFPWSADGERDDAWYETKQRTMLPWQLHQEYPRDDVEAFIRSGNPVFDLDDLKQHPKTTPISRGYFVATPDRAGRWVEAEEGHLHVWEHPVPGRRYVLGGDVAEGLEHGDYSVAQVIDFTTGNQVAKWRGHIPADLFGADVLWHLGWHYNCALIGIEVNNHGLTTATHLRDKGYPNIYYRHSYDKRNPHQRLTQIGWRTAVNTKPLAIDELSAAVRFPDPELVIFDAETIAEMERYVREGDGKMHGSPFDDQVMALAIANQMRKHEFQPFTAESKLRPWSLNWIVAQEDRESKRTPLRIGANNVRSS